MKLRRPSGALVFSIALHAVLSTIILNVAWKYDFTPNPASPSNPPRREQVSYVTVAPRGGVSGGTDSAAAPARAEVETRGLVAPRSVPTTIEPVNAPVAGLRGGVEGGRGVGGEITATTGITPGLPDPRLTSDPHAFYPVPKTHAERVDSAVKASIYAYNDSVERVMRAKGKDPGDWTFEKNGQKWGVDGNKIYLGKIAIPSAVLAALPIRIGQANPSQQLADRLASTRRADLLLHADAAYRDEEFKSAVKRIRERKDRERDERRKAEPRPVVTGPDIP